MNNTTDEYAMLVARYGKPYSIISTENDLPKPKVATRIARYLIAHTKLAFAPNGCVEAYDTAMRILADSSKYPALSREETQKMKRCVPPLNAGWTIVGYIDTADNQPISAQLARLYLDKITDRRTADPVVE